ncbi:MAG: bacteriophage CI repressor [Methylacidiphilales bacterium]|nr:bacteriophage CI repressor [Candidatus Methylacidiphilales bacterium]
MDSATYERAFDAEAILDRMKARLKIKSDRDLARALKISQSTLASWRRRRSVPLDVIVGFASATKMSLDWMFLGQDIDRTIPISEVNEYILGLAVESALLGIGVPEEQRAEVIFKVPKIYKLFLDTLRQFNDQIGGDEERRQKLAKTLAEAMNCLARGVSPNTGEEK